MTSAASTPRPGRGLPLALPPGGFALSAHPPRGVTHPWKTRPAWNGRARQWTATVAPGFLNGTVPLFRAVLAEQKALDENWGVNPLSGEPYFSASVFKKQTAENATRSVDVPLYLSPSMPLPLHAVGFGGEPGSVPPPFFRALGAQAAGAPPDFGQEPSAPIAQARRPGSRLLVACDFILVQPRSALTSTITQEPGPLTGISNVTQTLGLRYPPPGAKLRIRAGKFRPSTNRPDPLAFDYEEDTFDERLISTVYLLSPPDAEGEPDLAWQPFVRHQLFWNLCYEQPAFRPIPGDPGTPYIPPLAAGAAQLVINFLTASLNDLTTQAFNTLLGHSMAGTFWTATGGGHDGTIETDASAAAKPGLRKADALSARRAEAARRQRAQRLDPPFPYRAEPFDLSLLTA